MAGIEDVELERDACRCRGRRRDARAGEHPVRARDVDRAVEVRAAPSLLMRHRKPWSRASRMPRCSARRRAAPPAAGRSAARHRPQRRARRERATPVATMRDGERGAQTERGRTRSWRRPPGRPTRGRCAGRRRAAASAAGRARPCRAAAASGRAARRRAGGRPARRRAAPGRPARRRRRPTPPAVLDCTVPSSEAELARQRGRDRGAGGAGVDQEVDRPAVDRAAASGSGRRRPRRISTTPPVDAEAASSLLALRSHWKPRKTAAPTQQPDGDDLSVPGSSSFACAARLSRGPAATTVWSIAPNTLWPSAPSSRCGSCRRTA